MHIFVFLHIKVTLPQLFIFLDQSSQNKIVGIKFKYSYSNAILTLIPARFIIKYIFSFWIINGSHWWGMLEVRIHICYNFGQSHLWNSVGRGWYILLWLKTTTPLKSQDSLLVTRGRQREHHSSLWPKGTRFLKSQRAYSRPEAAIVACGQMPQGFISHKSRLPPGHLVTLMFTD